MGVTLGNLASSAMQAYLLVKVAEAATAEMERAATTAGERAQAESAAQLQRQKDERATSRTGRELFRLCEEWTESHRNNNVQATREGMGYHCARYHSYVETGVPNPR